MEKITSPFNFVPLSDLIYYPEWGDDIKHDIPFEDGEDGIIELEITNKSPLFIGEGKKAGNEYQYSAHVPVGSEKKYYIPGSTLKGCFRNVMEILSYGKMEQFDDAFFGYRDVPTKEYRNKLGKVKCGWLWKDGDKYHLEECVRGIQMMKHKDMETKYNIRVSPYRIYEEKYVKSYRYKRNNRTIYVPDDKYKFVTTGEFINASDPKKSKKYDYLFSVATREVKDLEISPEVIKSFETVHKESPSFKNKHGENPAGPWKEMYDNGEKIPVFYLCDNSKVICIGLTRNFKLPYNYSIRDLVRRKQDDRKDGFAQRDMLQCIFGNVGDSALKGRVQISSAFSDAFIPDSSLHVVDGVLAQPKASFYPLYLKQDGKKVVDYSTTESTIAGRKRYRITKDFNTIPLGVGNENESTQSHIRPLPAGLRFTCRINVHNLKKAEIGALLSSITFNNTGGCFHNIGMAKAFGYGIIHCAQPKLVIGFKHTIEEYIKCFDETISSFLRKNNRRLSKEVPLKRLFGIASPTHDSADMKQMDFNECGEFKKKNNPSLLIEPSKRICLDIYE